MRTAGLLTLLLGSLAIIGEQCGIAFPTARWFFNVSRKLPWLSTGDFPWFGWVSSIILILCGLWLVIRSVGAQARNPITERRFRRFREIKRGYYSFLILSTLAGIAALDQLAVGKRAIAVQQDGKWAFPALLPVDLKNKDFGVTGGDEDAPADYRKLKKILADNGRGKVYLPPIPFDPSGDTLAPLASSLFQREGIYHESRRPYYGLAARFHDPHQEKIHLRLTLRDGKFSGPVDGWNAEGTQVYSGEYKNGILVSDKYSGAGTKEEFLQLVDPDSNELYSLKYHPAPPVAEQRHWLGTTSQGYDVLAYLYGGLQVNFKAALIYLPIVYVIGMTVGMLMGYFGGWFDLTVQRIIEIFSNIPFLFVVIIISSKVPDQFKGLPVILTILVAFGWMGMTYLMRTAAYRDKERDYIAASRVLGAGTPRILFRHLLPNTVAIIVTLVPFTMSGLVFALTSLDYLGFGLPPEYATWGRLLNDGLSNLSAPWLVSSTFVVLVGLLVLITFIGEAVREAFDPKKFTYYR
jgi:microcin C transport system permease protein